MKRVSLFMLILTIVVTAFYLQPVLFPPQLKSTTQDQQMGSQNQLTSWKYQELIATGFSTYIGQSIDQLEKEIGQPKDRLTSGFGFEIRYYQQPADQLVLEATIHGNKIETIKVLNGTSTSAAPFKLGMSMQDLTDLTTIFPNFTFEYQETEVGIELTEEDMNYRPLIAFDNGTFAILFFDQNTGGLFAIVYLNKDSLLKLLPYQVFGEGLPHYQPDMAVDWEEVNQTNEKVVTQLFNRLRKKNELPVYDQTIEFTAEAHLLLDHFLNYPEEVLSESRLAEWQYVLSTGQTTARFSLTSDELNDLLKSKHVQVTTGIMMHPVIDPTFSFLLLYSDSYYHDRFLNEKSAQLGIAFSKENMLVLMQEKEETSKSSDH
ncbi:hypothetical protein A5844_000250 [Enterococcus sp. 10A9_DIV0425]|uniref:CAP-associated domain-containing protein n=1 Tax=Candidatus Enterococcus wittei TaxID=1987383 RepID=A0A2C9XPA0_9ENTE|nr:CAP-associated domain-containing protein [Enterococcus sp. 10A9_DIV0425]OTP12035.1 hypothetical protein A5844_000250 [Enterococcus sp. 10A9_DIV0425]THE10104.1 hypothetical protein E1H99_10150 [Enterococcus hirae]